MEINEIVELKINLIKAGKKAVKELIKVANDDIMKEVTKPKSKSKKGEEESIFEEAKAQSLSADRLKNAAAAKKLAIFDAFEILAKIELEQSNLDALTDGANPLNSNKNFAERDTKKSI